MLLDNGGGSALDECIVLQLRFHRSRFLFDPGNFFFQPLALASLVPGSNGQKNVAERGDRYRSANRRLISGFQCHFLSIQQPRQRRSFA